MINSSAAMEEAAARLSFSIALRIRTEATSETNGRFPESSTKDPYSPTPRAKLRAAPAAMAGVRVGRMTRRKTVNRLAPKVAAASSTSPSSCSSTGCTMRTMKGKVTNRKAR